MTCSTFAKMFLWLTTTAAGERVEPEGYCSRAVLQCGRLPYSKEGCASRSSASISITAGGVPGSARAHETTSVTTADVVKSTVGALSCRAAEARSSCAPNCGTDNGTAMQPASIAAKKSMMYSKP